MNNHKLQQLAGTLLFVTAISYHAWHVTNSKFFEEVFYFGFKPVMLISFIIYRRTNPRLNRFMRFCIIQVWVSIAWEVLYSINGDVANSTACLTLLFLITCFLIICIFFKIRI